MDRLIDLYSDTQTRPTAGMRAAMAQAAVGDEQSDEDPSTTGLCGTVAEMLGMEAAVFMPSGTMCNLVGILTHTQPGDELICDHQSHVYGTEAAGASAIAGVSVRAIESPHGIFTPGQVTNAVRPRTRTAPRSALLTVEQTTNFSGGAVWPLDQLRAVRDAAKAHGLKTHLDGARLLNATAASDVPPSEYAAGWDSAWIDLSKGLGCPVGAVLCGSAAFVRDAWKWKYRLGGAMRQSGVLAAAGLYALAHHVDRLKVDHAHAKSLWCSLDASGLFRFDPPQPASNILRFALSSPTLDTDEFARRCLARGVRVRSIGAGFIRAVTHIDVSEAQVAQAAQTLVTVARDLVADAAR